MFLDPEPKRRKTSRDMSPGFFSAQRPIASPRDPSRAIWRQALHERTQSQSNQQRGDRFPAEPTVRLVYPSPSPPPQQTRVGTLVTDEAKENWREGKNAESRQSSSNLEEEASVSRPRISATSLDWSVSDSHQWSNQPYDVDSTSSITLLPNNAAHDLAPPRRYRRSTSTGTYSQSSTLQDIDLAYSKKSLKSERGSDFSQISTLRGTITPTEQELRDRIEAEGGTSSESARILKPVLETSPERPTRFTTIRPVPQSPPSKAASELEWTDSSPSRPCTAPSDQDQSPSPTFLHRTKSKRTYSTGSIEPLRSRANTQTSSFTTSNIILERPRSRAISDVTFPQASSPNFIAYSPDSTGPISREDALRSVTSIESIGSRLQHGSAARPQTGQTLATSSSLASLRSIDSLPQIQVPKRRLRHKAKSESLASLASSSYATEMEEEVEDVDTEPYPKRTFSSHLSTIASESENSRNVSQQLSHFSLGSGVWTGDDTSSLPLSPVHKRQSSAPMESSPSDLASPGSPGTLGSEFLEEAGDMTLGIYREASAVPQPLFRTDQAQLLDTTSKRREPLPPTVPERSSHDSDEHGDTLTALYAPPLRQQKSGRSLRKADSTPRHSRRPSQVSNVDSERFSQGSNLFPMWVKRFYSGTIELRSKVSLNSLAPSEKRPAFHRRNQSSNTDRSITSRLGTGMGEGDSPSPGSSHFLPSIFRPRTRPRKEESSRSSSIPKVQRNGRSRPSQDTQDSMAIEPAPPLASNEADPNQDILPSGHPRWGELQNTPPPIPEAQHRLPRKYSKQQLWNQMEFPRPMTTDHPSDGSYQFHEPHLAPSKRATQRLSAWQAPSFVSGLDTLVLSRQNRQILCFMLGFVFPLAWMLGAVLPLPKRPMSVEDLEKTIGGSHENVEAAMMKHEAGDAEKRWREERQFLKARWWRMLNRIMSIVGLLVIGAVIALAVVATS